MSNIPSKSIRCTKRQENVMHNQKKNKSIEKDPRMTVMIKLAGKDFKTAYYKCAERFKGKHGCNE